MWKALDGVLSTQINTHISNFWFWQMSTRWESRNECNSHLWTRELAHLTRVCDKCKDIVKVAFTKYHSSAASARYAEDERALSVLWFESDRSMCSHFVLILSLYFFPFLSLSLLFLPVFLSQIIYSSQVAECLCFCLQKKKWDFSILSNSLSVFLSFQSVSWELFHTLYCFCLQFPLRLWSSCLHFLYYLSINN